MVTPTLCYSAERMQAIVLNMTVKLLLEHNNVKRIQFSSLHFKLLHFALHFVEVAQQKKISLTFLHADIINRMIDSQTK